MVKYNIDSFSFDDINKGKIILVDKPINWTSFDVVKYIRKSLQLKFKTRKIKVGHAGTLDPLATGLLIIRLKLYISLLKISGSIDSPPDIIIKPNPIIKIEISRILYLLLLNKKSFLLIILSYKF